MCVRVCVCLCLCLTEVLVRTSFLFLSLSLFFSVFLCFVLSLSLSLLLSFSFVPLTRLARLSMGSERRLHRGQQRSPGRLCGSSTLVTFRIRVSHDAEVPIAKAQT